MSKERYLNDACPDAWTLSRLVENRLDETAAGEVFAHVAGCMRCREKVSGLAEWLARMGSDDPTEKELSLARRVWSRAQWRHVFERFRPRVESLAAADGQTGDELQTVNALGSGFIHFLSRTPRGLREGWHVMLAIPACPKAKTVLRMRVLDGVERPVPSGTLYFCRLPLSVVDGQASLPLADFQRNMGEAFISLRREDGSDVPGDPVLGYDLLV